MVDVFVCDYDGIKAGWVEAGVGHSGRGFFARHSAVDNYASRARFDVQRVSGAAAAQKDQPHIKPETPCFASDSGGASISTLGKRSFTKSAPRCSNRLAKHQTASRLPSMFAFAIWPSAVIAKSSPLKISPATR